MRLILNILGFQFAWWACILSAQAGAPWWGWLATLTIVAAHLIRSPYRRTEIWFLPLAALLGYAVDTGATLAGALQFDTAQTAAPLWIAALWLAFASTLNLTFGWLQTRPLAAAALGAASGPSAYAVGTAFGVVSLPNPLLSTVILAASWGLLLPLLLTLAHRAQRRQLHHPPLSPTLAGDAS